MAIFRVPALLALPVAAALALTLPSVQRVLLPPPETVQALTEQALDTPEPAPPVQHDVIYHRDLLRRYRLDVYGPLPSPTDGPSVSDATTDGGRGEVGSAAPVIVFFHGGSWLRGDKVTIRVIHRFLRRMREEGWYVVAVNYTTSAYRGIRGPVRNAARSVTWVMNHADEYGWDPQRVGVYGVSAGGHVALMAASTSRIAYPSGPPSPRPALVLAECAPTDLQAMRRGDAFENSGSFALFPPWRRRRLSPVEHVDDEFPPTLIYHGDGDHTVAFRQARVLNDALTGHRVPHTLVRYPGGGHAFLNYSDAQWYEQESRAIRWMRSVFDTGLPPDPPSPAPATMPLYGGDEPGRAIRPEGSPL